MPSCIPIFGADAEQQFLASRVFHLAGEAHQPAHALAAARSSSMLPLDGDLRYG